MNFLSNFYRNSKIFVAGVGAIFAVGVIVVGAVITHGGIAIPLIVGGSTWLASSGCLLFDSIAVHSMIKKDVENLKKSITQFKQENLKLHTNVSQLNQTKDKFIIENLKLATSVTQSQDQIKRMSDIQIDYEINIDAYDKLLDDNKTHVLS